MTRVLAIVQSRWFRMAFMALAVAACVWAIVQQWPSFSAALARLPWWVTVLSLLASLAYVFLTMESWRALLDDLGAPVPHRAAAVLFFTSQVAKYLPGGVWNFAAAAEAGTAHAISRRRSVAVLFTSMLVSVLSGLFFAVLALLVGPNAARQRYGWAALALPILLVLLTPPILNRVLALAMRILRRPALERQVTWGGMARSTAWGVAAWLASGLQVWLSATALGMAPTPESFVLAVGGYGLAWTVGFLVFFIPAGVGVREAVLATTLTAYLAPGGVLAVVLLSRVMMTVADLAWGLGAALDTRHTREPLTASND